MKKYILLILILSAICFNTYAQNSSNDSTSSNSIFKLFPTQNMWNFIKLDSRNGLMWQVQYSMKSDKRFEIYLNNSKLISEDGESVNRFTLHPTQNIYTFLLLDQIDGRVWQVQWGMKQEERLIMRIY